MTLTTENSCSYTIEDLPDEVLEFILSLIPPYRDLHDCMLVCKRWRRCVLNVTKTKRRNLHRAIMEFDISWNSLIPVEMAPTISKRYSHSAAVYENSMYVYGGCTSSMTTFNDLWRLDLSKRQWVRPLTMGTYPSPKACSSMVCYKDCLVLFGGCTYPPSFPLHQSWFLFDELHTYDIIANRWTCITTTWTPPPTAGHSVSVHKNFMVVFGGLQKPNNAVHSMKTNDVWKLDLDTWTWILVETEGKKRPSERYGHSQTVLDENNVLIIGGSGGPSIYYSDAWILNMSGDVWKWKEVQVRNPSDAPINLWCNPVCKVGDKLIVLNRSRQSTTPPLVYYSKGVWVPPRESNSPQEPIERLVPESEAILRQVDRDENVNGRRGTLRSQKRANPDVNEESRFRDNGPPEMNSIKINDMPSTSGISLSAFNDTPNPRRTNAALRAKNLKRAEDKYKKPIREKENQYKYCETRHKPKRSLLGMYVLDISHVLDEQPYVTWLPNNGILAQGPEETVLYTLVQGKGELIMFGGIQKDANQVQSSNLNNQVTNSLHFITAPKYVI